MRISRKTAQRVFTRDNNQCTLCSSSQRLVVHHRSNRGMGGFRQSNYLTLCSSCNGALEADYEAARHALRRGIKVNKHYELERLATIPVIDHWGQKWFVDDDYGRKRA